MGQGDPPSGAIIDAPVRFKEDDQLVARKIKNRYRLMEARQLYIKDPSSNRIRLTRAGLDKYANRFAKVGYQASEIRTMEVLKEAIDASFDHEMVKLATTARDNNADLDEALSGLPGWN
ncbi:MAG: hypothetical protein AB2821_04805 [Candidatus Thiodiazotropha endolucinida]